MNIEETIEFVRSVHGGQLDRAGKEYWLHPVAVAVLLPEPTEEEVLIALLHDVVEDTSVTLEDLRSMGYSDAVVDAVSLLTRPRGTPYADWIGEIAASGNTQAIRVKIADNSHNLDPGRVAELPVDHRRRLVRRYIQSLVTLRRALP
jgi:(p)ppGpp synthase/HD superfamily hydrolase